MARFRKARRWAAAGLLAALGLTGRGALLAQDGIPLPPIGSAPPAQTALPPRLARSTAPSAPAPEVVLTPAPPATLPLPPKSASPGTAVPDDALGAVILPATPPGGGPAPAGDGSGCPDGGDGKGGGDRFANVPPIYPLPPFGWFPLLPTGPGPSGRGYFTALDWLQGNERQTAPRYPYRIGPIFISFFDVNWKYLDDPNNTDTDYWDFIKRQRFGPDNIFMWTSGGEFRGRYNYEANSRLANAGPRILRGNDNTYDLYRLRLYSDLYITERFRFFIEGISALTPDFLLPTPQVIDRNAADFQNLFIDVNPFDVAGTPLWLRVGRQELLYGSQRLISPLDWANTRRTFQGAKLFWRTDNDSVDAFVVQPVLPDFGRLDPPDHNQLFAGLWYTHRWDPTNLIDAYYLLRDDSNNNSTGLPGASGVTADPKAGILVPNGGSTVNTFGCRWHGFQNNWLWDIEPILQTGRATKQAMFAGACTCGGGYYFRDLPGAPTAWVYYDYASGTNRPGTGLNQTFNQLFPFGHYYFGWIDLVGRKNINDVNAEVTFFPSNWIFSQLQIHNFWLDSPRDALYNAAGVASRWDPTGRAGSYVGSELDIINNLHLTNHSDILFSYSYLWAGRFLHETATTPSGKRDPQAVYVQYSYKF